MRMDYEELKVWRDAFALLVRVSNLSDVLQDSESGMVSATAFESLKSELLDTLTFIYRAAEGAADSADDPEQEIARAAEHMVRSRIWIRVLMESREISRYVYQQLITTATSILKGLKDWQQNL